jgi:copper chaperone CopZ
MIKMKHTFTLKGMTCGGCKASVEKHLNLIDGVAVIEVNLEKEEVKLTTTKPISLKVLQDQLPPKFTLSASITDQETSCL